MSHLGLMSDTRASSMVRAVLTIAILSSISSLALAQQEWKELPVDPKFKPGIDFSKMLRGQTKMDEQAFDAPLMKFVFPNMTLVKNTKEDAKDPLAKQRHSFFVRFVNPARSNPEALKRVNAKTLEFFKPVISGKNFHPSVRSNAVLLIGKLNDSFGAGNTPTVPSRDALEVLLVCASHPAIPDFLKVNALLGLKRHAITAEKTMNVDQRDKVMSTMLTLLNQSEPPKDRDPEAHIWMRRGAAKVLANVGRPGRSNQVTQGLLAILANQNSPLSLRCTAAGTLGKLNAEAQFDDAVVSKLLARLALNVCLTERDLVETHGELNARRQLVYRLSLIETGLQAPLARDPKQAIAAPVSKQLNEMIEKFKKSTETVESLRGDLGTHCSQLQSVISKSSQDAPAATASPESKPVRLSDALK